MGSRPLSPTCTPLARIRSNPNRSRIDPRRTGARGARHRKTSCSRGGGGSDWRRNGRGSGYRQYRHPVSGSSGIPCRLRPQDHGRGHLPANSGAGLASCDPGQLTGVGATARSGHRRRRRDRSSTQCAQRWRGCTSTREDRRAGLVRACHHCRRVKTCVPAMHDASSSRGGDRLRLAVHCSPY